jgi:hypothetical protein
MLVFLMYMLRTCCFCCRLSWKREYRELYGVPAGLVLRTKWLFARLPQNKYAGLADILQDVLVCSKGTCPPAYRCQKRGWVPVDVSDARLGVLTGVLLRILFWEVMAKVFGEWFPVFGTSILSCWNWRHCSPMKCQEIPPSPSTTRRHVREESNCQTYLVLVWVCLIILIDRLLMFLLSDKLKPWVSHRDLNSRNILVKADIPGACMGVFYYIDWPAANVPAFRQVETMRQSPGPQFS